ncbi:Uncharacterised protein r2_g2094 [Pycnogonum litorale]
MTHRYGGEDDELDKEMLSWIIDDWTAKPDDPFIVREEYSGARIINSSFAEVEDGEVLTQEPVFEYNRKDVNQPHTTFDIEKTDSDDFQITFYNEDPFESASKISEVKTFTRVIPSKNISSIRPAAQSILIKRRRYQYLSTGAFMV